MFFLFSGEGPTDLGRCTHAADICEGEGYQLGPMAIAVEKIVESHHKYSLIATGMFGYAPKSTLTSRAAELKAVKKSLSLPGKKTPKETMYFYNNARVLSRIAREVEAVKRDEVVAVFFRDSDGSQSAGRGLWKDKVESMYRGFEIEGFERGVPMIPKPKSEAWILCALKYNYQCNALEDRSGNDNSPNSLKDELADHQGKRLSGDELVDLVKEGVIDVNRLQMPSFVAFRNRLENVIQT